MLPGRAQQEAARPAEKPAPPPIVVPEAEHRSPLGVATDPNQRYTVDGPFADRKPSHTWPWIAAGAALVAAGVVTAVLLSQSPRSACPTCTLPKVSIDTR